jgi:dolichyl-phosphate beta-glucosyltransferase
MDGPHLSIIIPALNEAARLPGTLTVLEEALGTWPFATEVILVDDGSSDGTDAIMAAAVSRDGRFRMTRHDHNLGKGAAIARGVALSRGAYVLFFDADLSYPLSAVTSALALLEPKVSAPPQASLPAPVPHVVIGARDVGHSDSRGRYGLVRRVSTRVFNALVESALHLGVRDTQCGFKAFQGDVARSLFPSLVVRGFGFDVELLFAARQRGLTIALLPLEMTPRDGSSVRVVRDSLRMARDVLRVRARGWMGRYRAP